MYLEKLLSLPSNEKIGIIGLGQENLQFIDWLLHVVNIKPSQILLADQREINLSNPILQDFKNIQDNIFSGDNYLDILKQSKLNIAFKAPGIWSLKPEFEEFRNKHGKDSIQSSLVFFYERYREQIITVTGTKGKSTTSSLLNHFLQNSQIVTSHYCGNTTNISPYQFWTNINQKINSTEYFVVEASSFQLQDLAFATISSHFGIITNYYIDHQDQHGTPIEYWKAKDTVYKYQKYGEITLITESVLDHSQSKKSFDNTALISSNLAHEIASRFSSSLEGSHNESNITQAVLVYLKVIDNKFDLTQKVQILSHLQTHQQTIQKSLDSYKPLSHRQEVFDTFTSSIIIKTKNFEKSLSLTVRFIDDGAATEPDAVVAAIKTLTDKANQYIWLFIAGKDKGGDLTNISQSILDTQLINRLYKINYTGEVGQHLLSNIYKMLGANLTPMRETFKQAVTDNLTSKTTIVSGFEHWITDQIAQLKEINDLTMIESITSQDIELNIVLSPCGSSFDEFDSYKERCLWFQKQVQSIK